MNREQIINNMCMTFRHDYELVISEDDRMYTLNSGMTVRERKELFNSMAQIFDHTIAPLLEDGKRIKEGTHIPMPVNVDQAKGMVLIGQHYMDFNQ
jgi:hypothetical protein